jgi:hypothetical protein
VEAHNEHELQREQIRHVFRSDPSEAKWMKEDFVDFLSTIDLRVALFLPTNTVMARGEVSSFG